MKTTHLSIILVQETLGSLVDAVIGLAQAIHRFESIGGQIEVVLVGRHDDPGAADFLGTVGGAKVLVSDKASFFERAQEGLAHTTHDLLWIGGSSEIPTPESIVWLLTAMDYDDCSMVRPDRSDARCTIIRRNAFQAPADCPDAIALVAELTNTVNSGGRRVSYRLEPRTAVSPGAPVYASGLQATINGGDQRNIMAGPHTYCAGGVIIQTWGPTETIIIGDYSMIGDYSRILHSRNTGRFLRSSDGSVRVATPHGGHRPETATSYPVEYIQPGNSPQQVGEEGTVFSAPVSIGSDVWIGYGSLVAGANIGHGAITMPGSVLIHDVPPYAIVGGNPAKILRVRFSAPTIEKLLKIRWWDWPVDKVRSEIIWFRKPISEFIKRFG